MTAFTTSFRMSSPCRNRGLLRAARVVAAALLMSACGTLPTAVGRDASILAEDARRVDATAVMPFAFAPRMNQPAREGQTLMGGLGGAVNLRRGLGDGGEQGVLFGANLLGAYAGYERAQQLTPGVVAFGGAAGGLHLNTLEPLPFVQPFVGGIVGRTEGVLRPELAVRFATQGGLISRDAGTVDFYAYWLGFSTVEPRLRLDVGRVSLVGGLTFGYGFGRCQECLANAEPTHFFVFGPFVGLGTPL